MTQSLFLFCYPLVPLRFSEVSLTSGNCMLPTPSPLPSSGLLLECPLFAIFTQVHA